MSAAFLLSLRHLGCDHGVPADPTATRLSRQPLDQHNGILAVGFSTSLLTRRRPGYSDGDPVFPTATRLSRRRPGWPVGISTSTTASWLSSFRRPCWPDGDPVIPTATRFSRPRPAFPDRDPVIPTATRLTRRHLDQHNGILAVGFSTSLLTRRRTDDPVFPTATRFSRPRPGYPDGDPADPSASLPAQRHPGCATVFPQRSCPRHDDGVLAVFRPCRQCPGVRLCPRHTGRVLAVPTVSWCVSSKCVLQTPVRYIVINPGHGHQL